ncbi:MAG: hypothetical protein AAF997_07120 [Myxococcota bacterium]
MLERLSSLSTRLLGALTLRATVLAVFATALVAFLDVPLEGPAAPYGIVSFELAGTPNRALAMLVEWRTNQAIGHAKLILIVDYLYMLIYGGFFVLLSLWLGAHRGDHVWHLRAARASVLAVAFDVLETSVLLFEVLRFSSPSPYPQLAAAFATAKFALLLVPIGYALVSAVALVRSR